MRGERYCRSFSAHSPDGTAVPEHAVDRAGRNRAERFYSSVVKVTRTFKRFWQNSKKRPLPSVVNEPEDKRYSNTNTHLVHCDLKL